MSMLCAKGTSCLKTSVFVYTHLNIVHFTNSSFGSWLSDVFLFAMVQVLKARTGPGAEVDVRGNT